jgi:hypothetical protein
VKLGKGVTPDWGETGSKNRQIKIHSCSPQVINVYPQEIPRRIGKRPPIKINQYNI